MDRVDSAPHRAVASGSSALRLLLCISVAYCAGTLDDNFYKESSMLLAVGAGKVDVQGWLAMAFVVPYLVLAAPAGWLADRYSKRDVVLLAKLVELGAVVVGAAGVWWSSWPLVVAMALLMGTVACLLNPAINGMLPELVDRDRLAKANGILKALLVVSVLAGVALSGVALSTMGPQLANLLGLSDELGKRAAIALVIIALGIVGVMAAMGVPRHPATVEPRPFPWNGPRQTLADVAALLRDRTLRTAALAGAYVWAAGSLAAMLLNPLGLRTLHTSEATTSLLMGVELIGVAIGGVLAGVWVPADRQDRMASPGLIVMGAGLAALVAVPWLPGDLRIVWTAACLFVGGAAGGMTLVPAEVTIQSRPPAERRGAVLSAYGFVFGAFVAASGMLANLLNLLLPPNVGFLALGATSASLGLVLGWNNRTSVLSCTKGVA